MDSPRALGSPTRDHESQDVIAARCHAVARPLAGSFHGRATVQNGRAARFPTKAPACAGAQDDQR